MPNVLPESPSILGHIFRKSEGHLLDTASNRALLLRVANDQDCFCCIDQYQNEWFAEMQADGTQLWIAAREGKIWDGGHNQEPISYNLRTGLKRQ